jgi:hypothetical protein
MLLGRSGSEEAEHSCSQGGHEVLFHWYEFFLLLQVLSFQGQVSVSFAFLEKTRSVYRKSCIKLNIHFWILQAPAQVVSPTQKSQTGVSGCIPAN